MKVKETKRLIGRPRGEHIVTRKITYVGPFVLIRERWYDVNDEYTRTSLGLRRNSS